MQMTLQAVTNLKRCVCGLMSPIYGYFPKPSKCILVAKPDRLAQPFKGQVQVEGSKDTGIEINCELVLERPLELWFQDELHHAQNRQLGIRGSWYVQPS